MENKTRQITTFAGKCSIELSKLKHIQQYINSFELDFIWFEYQPQTDQLSEIFTPSMEDIFDTLKTADININPSH